MLSPLKEWGNPCVSYSEWAREYGSHDTALVLSQLVVFLGDHEFALMPLRGLTAPLGLDKKRVKECVSTLVRKGACHEVLWDADDTLTFSLSPRITEPLATTDLGFAVATAPVSKTTKRVKPTRTPEQKARTSALIGAWSAGWKEAHGSVYDWPGMHLGAAKKLADAYDTDTLRAVVGAFFRDQWQVDNRIGFLGLVKNINKYLPDAKAAHIPAAALSSPTSIGEMWAKKEKNDGK